MTFSYTYTHGNEQTDHQHTHNQSNPEQTKLMEIEVDFVDVYGQTLAYPVCDKAKLFSALTKHKTLTADALKHIIALGYTVRIKQQPERYEV